MRTVIRDMKLAEEAIDAMAATTDFQEFERHWQDFLFRIEMVWEATSRTMQKRGGASQQWISSNAALRKKDALLRYLKHARDAETHVVNPTVSHTLNVSVRDRLGRPFQVESATVNLKEGELSFNINTADEYIDWVPELLPGDPILQRFKSRGDWYNPPHEHLGVRINDIHPVAVANLALLFYKARVGEVQEAASAS